MILDFVSRTLALLIITTLVLIWWYAASLQWRGESLAEQITSGKTAPTAFTPVPLSAAPDRAAAQRLLAQQTPNPEAQSPAALLKQATTLRPLYAPYWLGLAQAAYQAGQDGAAERDSRRALRLWPNRPDLLWKAAMLRTRMGDTRAALASLRDYLRADPGGYREALAVAARLEPRPAALLQAILPAHVDGGTSRDTLVWRVLRLARAGHDPSLGEAAWHDLSAQSRRVPDTVRYYVEWMASLDKAPEARRAWSHYLGAPGHESLENGNFEAPLQAGLGWRTWSRNGTAIERDEHSAYDGNYSLKVTFPGTSNINFAGVRQYLPVDPASRYTLSFAWRGRKITTRSGPYISVRSSGAGRLAETGDRWGTWDWERRELSFTVPATDHFVEVLVQRNRTDALDNKIAGELWLDDFALTGGAGGEASD